MWHPLVQADTMSYYVRSATRSCVITRGCKANVFRITQWKKDASYARSPSLYCYLSGTLAVCNFSLAIAKLYWTLCLEHFEAKAIQNGGGGSYYGAGGRLSGQTGRYYYNWQFYSNAMSIFDPFHGNWRIQLLTSTQTLFWAWLTFETIELDQIRLNLDKKNTIRFDQIQNLQFLISTAVLLPGLAAGSAISFPAVSLHFQNVLSCASSSTIHIQFIFVRHFLEWLI